ncbi:MAG: nitrilase-related carbon-nitrogen hydrolase [bacterium]|nr:nitrilase-related carbon-nitrogen hydrolase [bacterium]
MPFYHKKNLLFAILSGLILALAYPGWGIDLGWLVWIGFIPLFWALKESPAEKEDNKHFWNKKLFSLGFLAGFIYFSIVFRWIWSLHPLTTLGIENGWISFFTVGAVWLITSAGVSLPWGIAITFFGSIARKFNSPVFQTRKLTTYYLPIGQAGLLLAAPAVFTLSEYIRSFFFGLTWYGSGTLVGPHWTIGSPVYALANNPLALKLSSFVGIYGVFFLIIIVNFLVWHFWGQNLESLKKLSFKNRKIFILIAVVASLTMVPSLLNWISTKENDSITGPQINYALVQTSFPTKSIYEASELLNYFKEQIEILKKIAGEYPETNIIVLPESSNLFKNISLFQTTEQTGEFFKKLFDNPTIIIDNSTVTNSTGSSLSRVVSADSSQGALGYYDKKLLSPGGEFLPYSIKLFMRIFKPKELSLYIHGKGLTPGAKDVSTVNLDNNYRVSPIICSELFAPSLVNLTTRSSDVITVLTSNSIFRGSSSLIGQNLAIAKFRAAENNRPLLLSANSGLSYAIDNKGRVRNIAEDQDQKLLTGTIAIKNPRSWYNEHGDNPILLGSLMLAGMGFIRFRKLKFKISHPNSEHF